MGRKPLSGWARRLIHVAVLSTGWTLFVVSWWRVLTTQNVSYPILGWLIVGALALIPLVTLLWIRHNIDIFQRKGPRLRVRGADERYERDWEGRTINAAWRDVRGAQEIEIALDAERKNYLLS